MWTSPDTESAPPELVVRNETVTTTVTIEVESKCPRGSFCNAGAKFACPANTYNDVEDASDVSYCTPCPAGTLSNATGLASVDGCRKCPKGKWCSAGKEIPCSPGFYNDVPGGDSMASCKPCPAAATTATTSAATAIRARSGDASGSHVSQARPASAAPA